MTVPYPAAPCGAAARSIRPAWPLRSYLELDARPEAVRPARQHATTVARRWRLDALADTVELLVSELVTNAVLASAGRADQRAGQRAGTPAPQIRCWLASDRRQLMIHIWDAGRRLPVPQDAGPDAQTGRGLLLVATLSARWGCYSPHGRDGKIVWALCAP
jgi:anti-sigma regulatory factor (Ser/Thr protein kinase)